GSYRGHKSNFAMTGAESSVNSLSGHACIPQPPSVGSPGVGRTVGAGVDDRYRACFFVRKAQLVGLAVAPVLVQPAIGRACGGTTHGQLACGQVEQPPLDEVETLGARQMRPGSRTIPD